MPASGKEVRLTVFTRAILRLVYLATRPTVSCRVSGKQKHAALQLASMGSLPAVLITSGLSIIVFAAVKITQLRDSLALQQQSLDQVPFQLACLLAVGAAVSLAGALDASGSFKPIKATKYSRASDRSDFRPDFISFEKRAQAVGHDLPPIAPVPKLSNTGPLFRSSR